MSCGELLQVRLHQYSMMVMRLKLLSNGIAIDFQAADATKELISSYDFVQDRKYSDIINHYNQTNICRSNGGASIPTFDIDKVISTTKVNKDDVKPPDGNSGSNGGRRKNDEKWFSMYDHLINYKKSNGDCMVPRGYEEIPGLANWVSERNVVPVVPSYTEN